jgi:AcrR family transcriptional regulator
MDSKKYHHGDLKNALIQAGAQILVEEGAQGLSLRKVAQRAGVSHSAPYAHFSDKQALIAAISTEGFNQLYIQLDAATTPYAGDAKNQLIEGARAYARFATQNLDTFKIMFSGILEKEKEYPAFVEISQKTFSLVLGIVQACQSAGLLRPASPELMAVSVWGQVHGIISLALEGQVSHSLLECYSIQDLVTIAVEQTLNTQA